MPLVQAECVDRQHWLTNDEFVDALAFGNALPGPIAQKLAAHIGMKVAGWPGVVVSLLAVTAPGVTLMLGAMALYLRYRHAPAMEGMLRGVRPAVVGLLAYTAYVLAPDAVRDWKAGVIAVAAFGALAAHVHPAVVMLAAILLGVAALR